MKILLTGGAGFIASHIADRLLAEGFEVVVVDDLSTGAAKNLNPRVRFYKIDIRQPELEDIFKRERPDFINHHAGQISIRLSTKRPIFDAEVNIVGSLNLLALGRHYRVKGFIYSSSGGAVYGEPTYLPCDEDHPINPLSPYGVSKHTVEHYLYCSGLPHIILRYANVYGPRQDPGGEAGVVAIFTRAMLHDQQVVINGDGNQERDFVYVTDIVEANVRALRSLLRNNHAGVYNVGTGQGTSITEIFIKLRNLTGYRREPVMGPPLSDEIYKISLNALRIKHELGWQPTIDLDNGLKNTVEWFKRNPS